MCFVYILKLNNGQYYIGSTNDIERRVGEHSSGKTKSIKYKLPLKLVLKQKFVSISKARSIENKLKKLKSRKIVEKIIKDQEIKMGL